VLKELLDAGKLRGGALTVTGKTVAENLVSVPVPDREVIRPYGQPMRERAGYLVMSGNLFEAAVMKVSAINPEFRERYLSKAGDPNAFEGRAVVFEGPEDYHQRINDPGLDIAADCILFIRNCGPVGYPGSAEVVNMQPPDALLKRGITSLPTCGDGRQSGTSASPSILNASPEAAVGGGLSLLETGDRVRVDLNTRRVDLLVAEEELTRRRARYRRPELTHQTPWQEIYRAMVGQLSTGACLEPATLYLDIVKERGNPRHSH